MQQDFSYLWFLGVGVLTAAGWVLGLRIGRRCSHTRGRCAIVAGLVLIMLWAWLIRHPAWAVQVIPVRVLSRVEGIGGVPIFMCVLGIAWGRSVLPRQRHVITWAIMLGAIHFVNGGRWLLQETPSAVMGQTVEARLTRQSQDYSCVPAACATVLNLLNLPSTEVQMAELTLTRPGSGATIVRALDGLEQRLAQTRWRAHLLEPDLEDLARLPLPAITPLQFEPSRRHMVVITQIDTAGIWLMDPSEGYLYFSIEEFRPVFRHQVIVFRPRG